MGTPRPCREKTMREIPTAAPMNDDRMMVRGSICQPHQAPMAASSLKSPNPMPSLPVKSLNSQYTLHSARYPAAAPITAERRSVNTPPVLSSNPSHSRGRVIESGSSCVSKSMKLAAMMHQRKTIAPNAAGVKPNRAADHAAAIPPRSSTTGYRALMRALHFEQRPRSTAQESSGMFSRAVMPCPHEGQAERGTKRLYGSSFGGGEPLASSWHSAFHARSIILGRRWMATFRNEPTARPTAKQTSGKTAGWASASIVSLIRAGGALLDRLTDLEYRQVHRDDHAADQYSEHDHDHRFHQTGQRFDRVVDLGFEEIRHLAEHGVERARFLADRHHLHHHVGKDRGLLHRHREAGAGADLPLDLLGGLQVDVVPRRAAHRVQGLDERHARGEHGRERARPARNRRLADQVAEDRYPEQPAIHRDLHRHRALP